MERSVKLFTLLTSMVRGRPLLIIRSQERSRNGYEALRLLRKEMEPKERVRSLAIAQQLASWRFNETQTLHEQVMKYEDMLKDV